ncbi:hypothetical protein PAECIP111891_05127 [Paenibacillus allorhizoplanae]|uniref:Uncharacterized protein n=1 Tax=Paenibacillus allorhizoplanae TaxID=2905648 RepID=A0ABM9CS50_9BACL|nr:hypothetical protein PAECIP111891_05127 [Paenibacillus allorhizoplanae]
MLFVKEIICSFLLCVAFVCYIKEFKQGDWRSEV